MITGTAEPSALIWFRQDLRLSDNPALAAAVDWGGPVIPVFIWAPDEEGSWRPGAASEWWLDRSLAALNSELERRGSRLIVRRGPTGAALNDLLAESGATAVFWNRRYEPAAVAQDRELSSRLRGRGITAESFHGNLLFEPSMIQNSSGQPFRIFSAFWRACLTKSIVPPAKMRECVSCGTPVGCTIGSESAAWIHKPWQAPESLLVDAGIRLGRTYPMPIVSHEAARQRALSAFASIRAQLQIGR